MNQPATTEPAPGGNAVGATYDVVALIPIVERAGGRMTNWEGKPATEGGRILASGDPRLHDRVLKLLNP